MVKARSVVGGLAGDKGLREELKVGKRIRNWGRYVYFGSAQFSLGKVWLGFGHEIQHLFSLVKPDQMFTPNCVIMATYSEIDQQKILTKRAINFFR